MRFLVAGSLNYDLVTYVGRLPVPGEALPAREMRRDLGGKGFNQAVALRRLGAEVEMVGAVGPDSFGDEFLGRLDQLGIGRRWVVRSTMPTGLAVPVVADDGENWIVVALGANLELRPGDLAALDLGDREALLLQGELRPETNRWLAGAARAAGVSVLLNAGPATPELEPVIGLSDLVVVNQTESETLGGAARILELGAGQVVMTVGADGAELRGRVTGHVPAPRVEAIDTVGAGDAFVAALATAVAESRPLQAAAAWAACAGALASTVRGTSRAMPDRAAVDALAAAARQ
jgi:ribokinase